MLEKVIFSLKIIAWTIVVIFLAFLVEWFYRKVLAHMQHRVGPKLAGKLGILQPIADFIKLMRKRQISPAGTDEFFVDFTAIFGLWLMIIPTMFLPIFGLEGFISFEGDAVLIIMLLAISSLVYIVTPYLFPSPYPTIGAGRRAELYLSYEIPMFLAFASAIFAAGSLRISEIIFAPTIIRNDIPTGILLVPALIVAILSSMSRLKKVPFDAPVAETEIAGGWEAELSGRRLAFFNLLTDVKLFVMGAIITTFFLGGPLGPMILISGLEWILAPVWYGFWFFLKTVVVIFIITAVSAATARFRIDQVLKIFWDRLLYLSVFQVILLILWWSL
ncbi:MAG: NADH-quinone oxidoreductase subunit H [Crenarchaeota archaeon]|nr:NADH-quinone oxidoreductase subunit H [Thermoproteota archaeon]MCR8471185.1 NADH-quinone oxidoreductase subunit H [Thermoproteota archaeon]MCR8472339.1 NADH-quinone oxidoreductase subunit H [Thermoproteota archaeon]MCR8473671.1 NADH-quinone oxidoreductase subunit H [Thermoproteota archaeon]MCR8489038.1 NADH-quinone oxidoreductase subunit H [Thermoproteota archaeon]